LAGSCNTPLRGKDAKKEPKLYETREAAYTFEDGWTIERIQTPNDCAEERRLMGHCLQPSLLTESCYGFSLRRPDGTPHVTIITAVDDGASGGYYKIGRDLGTDKPMMIDGKPMLVIQCRGRSNALAAHKYWDRVVEWYNANGGEGADWEKAKANPYQGGYRPVEGEENYNRW
jgi:hypothetical protein